MNSNGGERTVVIRPWSSLTYPDYRWLVISSLFSGASMQMQQLVNLFLVYELSGSAVDLGLTGLFQAIPSLFVGLFSGALADRMARKKLVILCRLLNLLPPLALGVLALTGTIRVWHIFVFTAVSSAARLLSMPAQNSLIPHLVPPTHLLNAITFYTSQNQVAHFVGPLLAGIFIDWVGVGPVYFLNGFFVVLSLVSLLAIKAEGIPEGANRRFSLRTILEGFQFVWRQQMLMALFLLDFGVIIVGYIRPLLPILAKDVFHVGASGLGILNAAPAVGSVLGSATILLAGEVQRKGVLVLTSTFLYALGLGFLGLSSWFWIAVVAVAVLGYTDIIGLTVRRTLTHLLAPDQLRGRASSISSIMAQTGNGLGAMEAGFVAALIGAPGTLLLGGALSAGVVLGIGLWCPQLWQYRS